MSKGKPSHKLRPDGFRYPVFSTRLRIAHSPEKKRQFREANVKVKLALMIASESFLRLSSPNKPEGISIATTSASDWLI